MCFLESLVLESWRLPERNGFSSSIWGTLRIVGASRWSGRNTKSSRLSSINSVLFFFKRKSWTLDDSYCLLSIRLREIGDESFFSSFWIDFYCDWISKTGLTKSCLSLSFRSMLSTLSSSYLSSARPLALESSICFSML